MAPDEPTVGGDGKRHRALMENESLEIGRQLERAQVMFMEGVVDLNTLKVRTAPLEARRQELNALLSEAAPQTVQLHPGVAEAYQRLAEDLQQALEGDTGEDLRTELRKLIERVDFMPLEGLGKFDCGVTVAWPSCWAWAARRKQKTPRPGAMGFL
ncbi:hypothetical protein D3C71_233660 [compost metagenome]